MKIHHTQTNPTTRLQARENGLDWFVSGCNPSKVCIYVEIKVSESGGNCGEAQNPCCLKFGVRSVMVPSRLLVLVPPKFLMSRRSRLPRCFREVVCRYWCHQYSPKLVQWPLCHCVWLSNKLVWPELHRLEEDERLQTQSFPLEPGDLGIFPVSPDLNWRIQTFISINYDNFLLPAGENMTFKISCQKWTAWCHFLNVYTFFLPVIDPCGLPVFCRCLVFFYTRASTSDMSSRVDVWGSRITQSIVFKGKQLSLIAVKCNSEKASASGTFHRAERCQPPCQVFSHGPQELHLDCGWLVIRNATPFIFWVFHGNSRWRIFSFAAQSKNKMWHVMGCFYFRREKWQRAKILKKKTTIIQWIKKKCSHLC